MLFVLLFQDSATELVVFVLHSLKNQRECHMMGESVGDEEEEENVSKVGPLPLNSAVQLMHLRVMTSHHPLPQV